MAAVPLGIEGIQKPDHQPPPMGHIRTAKKPKLSQAAAILAAAHGHGSFTHVPFVPRLRERGNDFDERMEALAELGELWKKRKQAYERQVEDYEDRISELRKAKDFYVETVERQEAQIEDVQSQCRELEAEVERERTRADQQAVLSRLAQDQVDATKEKFVGLVRSLGQKVKIREEEIAATSNKIKDVERVGRQYATRVDVLESEIVALKRQMDERANRAADNEWKRGPGVKEALKRAEAMRLQNVELQGMVGALERGLLEWDASVTVVRLVDCHTRAEEPVKSEE